MEGDTEEIEIQYNEKEGGSGRREGPLLQQQQP